MNSLATKIEQLIDQTGAECVGVATVDLETGQELFLNADVPFHPASTMKVCLMMELFRQAHEGRFSLGREIVVRNSFVSIADGSFFSVSREDDAEQSLYDRMGQRVSLRELNRLMIVRSSNLATNLLIELVSASSVTETMKKLGAGDLLVLRGPEDNRAHAAGLNNVATARGMTQILRCLAEGQFISPEASRGMIDVLLGQEFNTGLPALLPKNVRVAHKTGWIDRHFHDFGILLSDGRRPLILSVMTRGIEREENGFGLIARISAAIWESVVG
ncbi:MAG: serine hydrolase [Armatimonadetes bacterium]|nr:serine hydrolase [Armatimonadota bacterium]MBS1726842.1 serine hydrolase [Armatimonadota bacterium]